MKRVLARLTKASPRRPDPAPSGAKLPGGLEMSVKTGPMEVIRKKRVLAVADAQNLDQGARNLGFKISWSKLANMLDSTASRCSRHAVFSQRPMDDRKTRYFAARGWEPHSKRIHSVHTRKGRERSSNADFLLAFTTCELLSSDKWSVVVFLSGDGELVEDLAEAVLNRRSDIKIATMSLPGSTAWRLNAEFSEFISSNIEIGMDCLRVGNSAALSEPQRNV